MKTWIEERIGNPGLFTGRKKELAFFLNWIEEIPKRISQSSAILSRRKTGKTALLERLFNLTFHKNGRVIPFYFEIRESDQWIGDFAEEFFLTFIYQFIAFRTRKQEYLDPSRRGTLNKALSAARKEKLDHLSDIIENAIELSQAEKTERLWDIVKDAPRMAAMHYNMFAVQIIDEFQFINRFIFRDKGCTKRIDTLAGSYLRTSEYKNAPLLVSGSWVGWLMDDLNKFLPGRFVKHPLEDMPEEEALETVCKYSLIRNVPITEETSHLIVSLTEGNPFYISALFGSRYPGKRLDTSEGVRKTLEFETMNLDANINSTWMEYIDFAFPKINEKYAKDIVLYLSAHRERRVGHRELREKLGLDMTDPKLEKKLKAIFRSDIIEEDGGLYRGVRDNIFDKVFRRSYSDDIHHFVTREAPEEYRKLFEEIREKYERLRGKYSRYKGAFAEFMIIHHLISAFRNSGRYTSVMANLPDDFAFMEYESLIIPRRCMNRNSRPMCSQGQGVTDIR
ncbi:hypothetical protein QUF80_09060 [Desulfococcaceae bacterium HSG8]|nr:hypothetical protein [Desulfococcaceae bacterium HSG8]